MPEQGGVYVWVRRAFGRFPAALTSLLYWAGTPMWLGGSITAIALSVHEQFVGDLGPGGRYAFAALFIGVATFAAVVPLRFGKWVPSSGAIGQTVLLGFFTVTVMLYGASRGIHGIAVGDLSPSTAGFIAVAPILLYSFVGIELPTAAAGEMRNPRLAYLMIYPAFLALRHAEPDLDRPFRAPGGAVGATVATVLATGWSLLTATCLLWPGFGTADPDRHLPAAFADEHARFEVLVIALLVVISVAAAFAGREREALQTRPEHQSSGVGEQAVASAGRRRRVRAGC